MLPTSFIERPNKTAVYFLLSRLNNEFWASHYMKDEDHSKKQSITLTKKYLEECKKNNCIVRANYKPSKLDIHNNLRLYGDGIQNIPSRFRGLLFGENTTDIDIVNCHPSILRRLCEINDIKCPQLDYYCDNRKKIIDEKQASKTEVVVCMYMSESVMTYSPFLKLFDAEIKVIQRMLYDNDRYDFIRKMVNSTKKNPIGTFLSYLLQYHERLIVSCACDFLNEKKIEICSQMFDGCMVYGEFSEVEELEKYVFEKSSFPVKFAIKPHNSEIVIPDDFEFETNEDKYLTMKKYYENEEKLSFIKDISSFVIKDFDKIYIKSKSDMMTHFENIFYDNDKHFFSEWLKDPERQTFSKMESIPHDKICPEHIFNLWTGFAVEKIKGKIVPIDEILEHISILCGRNDEFYHFMLSFFANFFQFPSHTSIMPFIHGCPGCGKGIFLEFIKLLIGEEKFFLCEDFEKDMMGQFNGHLRDVMFVYLDEIEYKNTSAFYERIKSMITRSSLSVNEKGQKRFTMPHYIKYFATSNTEFPFNIKEGDRRIAPNSASDELKNNDEYFKRFGELIQDTNIQYSFYQYLMSYATKQQLMESDIPQTDLLKNTKILFRDSIEDYISVFSGTCSSDDFFTGYKQFMIKSNLECKIPLKSFQMKAKGYFEKYGMKVKDIDRKTIRGRFYYVGEFDESIFNDIGYQS